MCYNCEVAATGYIICIRTRPPCIKYATVNTKYVVIHNIHRRSTWSPNDLCSFVLLLFRCPAHSDGPVFLSCTLGRGLGNGLMGGKGGFGAALKTAGKVRLPAMPFKALV